MTDLAAILLSNALLVVPLVLVVAVTTCFVRQPALAWALWGLVLLKFVTPAVLPLPVDVTSPLRFHIEQTFDTPATPPSRARQEAAPRRPLTPRAASTRVGLEAANVESEIGRAWQPLTDADRAAISLDNNSTGVLDKDALSDSITIAPPRVVLTDSQLPHADSEHPDSIAPSVISMTTLDTTLPETLAETDNAPPATSISHASRTPTLATRSSPLATPPLNWPLILWTVWGIGGLVVFALALWRIIRFRRLLNEATPADADLVAVARTLADQLGLRRLPDLRLTDGCVPPLLYGGPRGTTILLPRRLLAALDDESRRTLLAHELAHVARRDHWMRWLELSVRCLYWWHPLAWWSGRRLREAEELCCDARVVALLPQSAAAYAHTILATVDYLSGNTHPVPTLATGLEPLRRSVRPLHRRLTMIVNQNPTPKSAWLSRLLVLALAVCVLPVALSDQRTNDDPDRNNNSASSADSPPRTDDDAQTLESSINTEGTGGDEQAAGTVADATETAPARNYPLVGIAVLEESPDGPRLRRVNGDLLEESSSAQGDDAVAESNDDTAQQQPDTSQPHLTTDPRIRIMLSSADEFLGDLEWLVADLAGEEQQWKDNLFPSLDIFLFGIDRQQPLNFDLLPGARDGQWPQSRLIRWQTSFPIAHRDEGLQAFIRDDLAPIGINVARRGRDMYQLQGTYNGWMRVIDDYACLGASAAEIPETITSLRAAHESLRRAGYDAALVVNNESPPLAGQPAAFAHAIANLNLVGRPGESTAALLLRANLQQQRLALLDRLLFESRRLSVGWTTDRDNQTGNAKLHLQALPETSLADDIHTIGSRPSAFAALHIPDEPVAGIRLNWPFSTTRQRELAWLLSLSKPVVHEWIFAGQGTSAQQAAAKAFVDRLTDLLAGGIQGRLDLMLDLEQTDSEQLQLLAGLRVASSRQAEQLLQYLPNIQPDCSLHSNISAVGKTRIHALHLSGQLHQSLSGMFGDSGIVYVGTGSRRVWISTGPDSLKRMQQAIALANGPQPADPVPVFCQFNLRAHRLLGLYQELADKLGWQSVSSRTDESAKPSGWHLLSRADLRAIALEATADIDDHLTGQFRQTENQLTGDVEVAPGLLRAAGKIIARFADVNFGSRPADTVAQSDVNRSSDSKVKPTTEREESTITDGQSGPIQVEPDAVGDGVVAEDLVDLSLFRTDTTDSAGGGAGSTSTETVQRSRNGALDAVLAEWEEKAARISRLRGTHRRYVYDTTFAVERRAVGEFWYEAADRYRINFDPPETLPDPPISKKSAGGQQFQIDADESQTWVCNGDGLLKIDHLSKTYAVADVPERSQEERLMDCPLPFLLGMTSKAFRQQYHLLLGSQHGQAGDDGRTKYHIVMVPRAESSAQRIHHAEVFLDAVYCLPTAFRFIDSSMTRETVYVFPLREMKANEKHWQTALFDLALVGYRLVDKEALPSVPGAVRAGPGEPILPGAGPGVVPAQAANPVAPTSAHDPYAAPPSQPVPSQPTRPQVLTAPQEAEEISVVARVYELHPDVVQPLSDFLDAVREAFPVYSSRLLGPPVNSYPGYGDKPAKLRIIAPESAQAVLSKFIHALQPADQAQPPQPPEAGTIILVKAEYELAPDAAQKFALLLGTCELRGLDTPLMVKRTGTRVSVTTSKDLQAHIRQLIDYLGENWKTAGREVPGGIKSNRNPLATRSPPAVDDGALQAPQSLPLGLPKTTWGVFEERPSSDMFRQKPQLERIESIDRVLGDNGQKLEKVLQSIDERGRSSAPGPQRLADIRLEAGKSLLPLLEEADKLSNYLGLDHQQVKAIHKRIVEARAEQLQALEVLEDHPQTQVLAWDTLGVLATAITPLQKQELETKTHRAGGGMQVALVKYGGPCEKAGIKTGDTFISINGDAITSYESLGRGIQELDQEQTSLEVEFFREGELRTATLDFRGQVKQPNPASTQVSFLLPKGMSIDGQIGKVDYHLVAPARYNFPSGATFHLNLSNIPGRDGMVLAATLQISASNQATDGFLDHNSLPLQLTNEDLDQIASNNFVTKVFYLPDGRFQELAVASIEELVSTRLDPGIDPLAEADRRGTILAIFRVGNRHLKNDAAQAQRVPAELQQALAIYEEAFSHERQGTRERAESLDKAAAAFEAIHQKYRSRLAGLYARLWQGRCYVEQGEIDKALGIFDELLKLEGESYQDVQDQARWLRLICLNHEDRREYQQVLDEATAWRSGAGDRQRSDVGLGIQYELAKALESLSADPSTSQARRADLRSQARRHVRELDQYPGSLRRLRSHQEAAEAMIQRLTDALLGEHRSRSGPVLDAGPARADDRRR